MIAYAHRPVTPIYIRDHAVKAIEAHDSQTLLNLADPEEVKRLNLTPEAVYGILSKTLWSEGALKNAHFIYLVREPVDEAIWKVNWETEPKGMLPGNIEAIDSQKHLNITDTENVPPSIIYFLVQRSLQTHRNGFGRSGAFSELIFIEGGYAASQSAPKVSIFPSGSKATKSRIPYG